MLCDIQTVHRPLLLSSYEDIWWPDVLIVMRWPNHLLSSNLYLTSHLVITKFTAVPSQVSLSLYWQLPAEFWLVLNKCVSSKIRTSLVSSSASSNPYGLCSPCSICQHVGDFPRDSLLHPQSGLARRIDQLPAGVMIDHHGVMGRLAIG